MLNQLLINAKRIADKPIRSVQVPLAPNTGNNLFAIEAPLCTLTIDNNTAGTADTEGKEILLFITQLLEHFIFRSNNLRNDIYSFSKGDSQTPLG